MKKRKLLLLVFAAGVITNLVWENVQAPLYEGHEGLFSLFFYSNSFDSSKKTAITGDRGLL